MKKEKWLLNEIDAWLQDSIISEDTATILRTKYTPEKNVNTLIILFSIIGSLLIGAGVILLGARNWNYFPTFVKVILAFLPLITSQTLALYVVKLKYSSVAWRESVSLFMCAAVFTVIAMVGQIFHLAGDFSTYVLTCGLLSLPIMFILNSASPLLIYYWTILNWALIERSGINALALLILFAFGALFVFKQRKQADSRLLYMTWVTVIAGFAASLILGAMLESSLLLTALCYFVLLLSIEELPDLILTPFKVVGLTGALVTTAILTYIKMWGYIYEKIETGGAVLVVIMLTATLLLLTRIYKRDKLKFSFILVLLFLCLMRFVWSFIKPGYVPYEFAFMVISNMALFIIGVGFIIYGTKNINLLNTNIGMTAICVLIIMRFFDSGMDFFWRGIIFLILGVVFLLVNLKILRIKKQRKENAL